MNDINKTILDAVIKKANALCPDSLALIGVYGSVATGDAHEKSDLDLMILIEDEKGQVLAEGFILDDIEVGYDLYCTSWDMLERDAQCSHAHLSKPFDSKIVYCKDDGAIRRLNELRKKAAALLASEKRYDAAQGAFRESERMFAEAYLSDSLSKVRSCAGIAIEYLENAVMLYHGLYFKKGTKHTFEELGLLSLPFDLEALIMSVIRADTVESIRERLKELLVLTGEYLQPPKKKQLPTAENLCGTYEEMYSNWKNKMSEAADRNDAYSSFMNLLSLQCMLHEIAKDIAVEDAEIMDQFDPNRLENNAGVFDRALRSYLAAYEKAGICSKRYGNAEEFAEDYCKGIFKQDISLEATKVTNPNILKF